MIILFLLITGVAWCAIYSTDSVYSHATIIFTWLTLALLTFEPFIMSIGKAQG